MEHSVVQLTLVVFVGLAATFTNTARSRWKFWKTK